MITDVHVHYSPQTGPEFLTQFLDTTGTDRAVIQAVSHTRCLSLIPGALVMKDMSPGRFYVFGSPDLSEYYMHPDTLGQHLAQYGELILAAGCDGIKLLEGKPQMRKTVPVPDFDAPCWEPFWAWAEEKGVPLLWHVNDPEQHWSPNPSAWLVKQGWWYDESFINNEVQYSQVLAVLERHPGLKIIFAHFFFMSAQLERLEGIMDRFPNIMVDLTPGIEMYENFSADIANTKRFFEKFALRIAYGTDTGGRCILTNEGEEFNEKENLRRGEIVQSFLSGISETVISADGEFIHERAPFTMRPLGLEGQRLENILSGNVTRLIGQMRPVDAEKALELCAYLREKMAEMVYLDNAFHPDASEADMAERYFCRKLYDE